MYDLYIRKRYSSGVSYLNMFVFSTYRIKIRGKNNTTKCSCILPPCIEVPKENEVTRGTDQYMICWCRKNKRRKMLLREQHHYAKSDISSDLCDDTRVVPAPYEKI